MYFILVSTTHLDEFCKHRRIHILFIALLFLSLSKIYLSYRGIDSIVHSTLFIYQNKWCKEEKKGQLKKIFVN